MSRPRPLPAVLCAALAAQLTACGGDEAPSDQSATATPHASSEQAEAPPEAALTDIRAPEFAGLSEVELVGLERYTLRWEPAEDDISPVEALRYRVYHIVEPYLTLSDDMAPILTTEPGVLEVTLANAAESGRFFVRAVDEAGNASALTPGLMQRSRRPLVWASDGRLAASITACAPHPAGTLCVGEEGFAARWSSGEWEPLELGVVANLRLANTPAGVFIYSELGHLFSLDDEGDAALVELKFPLRAPDLPFRQFAADDVGLRYWIDDGGRTFVGAHDEFVPMTRPIAVPGDACRRLRGVTYGAHAHVALCEGDVAFSRNAQDPRSQWLSLTPNAAFSLPHGLDGVIADRDTEVITFDPAGVRRIGVGGWAALLLTDWSDEGVHPMDVPDEPFDISAVRGAFELGERLYAATDIGLLVTPGGDWELVEGTAGELAGALPFGDGISLIYEDGAVGHLARARVRWERAPTLSGFERGFTAADGTALAVVDGALWAWSDEGWVARNRALPGGNIAGLTGSAQRLTVYGDVDGVGAIWSEGRAGFRPAEWRYPPATSSVAPTPSALAPAADAEDAMVFDDETAWAVVPPSPLVGVAGGALTDAPTPEPIVHVDVSADGRGVAISEHQVWWRWQDTWLYLGRREGALSAAFLDVDETYVLVEDGTAIRCWRSECSGAGADAVEAPSVTPAEGAPSELIGRLPGGSAKAVLGADGQIYTFSAAHYDGPPLIEPALELPAGSWTASASLGRHVDVVDYVEAGDAAALVNASGELYERVGDRWELQGEHERVLSLLAVADGWAILTHRGLFRLGDVRPALRDRTD